MRQILWRTSLRYALGTPFSIGGMPGGDWRRSLALPDNFTGEDDAIVRMQLLIGEKDVAQITGRSSDVRQRSEDGQIFGLVYLPCNRGTRGGKKSSFCSLYTNRCPLRAAGERAAYGVDLERHYKMVEQHIPAQVYNLLALCNGHTPAKRSRETVEHIT